MRSEQCAVAPRLGTRWTRCSRARTAPPDLDVNRLVRLSAAPVQQPSNKTHQPRASRASIRKAIDLIVFDFDLVHKSFTQPVPRRPFHACEANSMPEYRYGCRASMPMSARVLDFLTIEALGERIRQNRQRERAHTTLIQTSSFTPSSDHHPARPGLLVMLAAVINRAANSVVPRFPRAASFGPLNSRSGACDQEKVTGHRLLEPPGDLHRTLALVAHVRRLPQKQERSRLRRLSREYTDR